MKLTISIDSATMTLVALAVDGTSDSETYNMNTGIAVAANLRQALASCRLLQNPRSYDRVSVCVDTPTQLVPIEEFSSEAAQPLFCAAMPLSAADEVATARLDQLGVVAVFAVNRDLHFVLSENFRYVQFVPRIASTLAECQEHAYGGFQEKLFCIFRGKAMDIVAFRKRRIRFCNSFTAEDTQDAVYFIMGVWQQLAMKPTDILCISGSPAEPATLDTKLRQFVKNVECGHSNK